MTHIDILKNLNPAQLEAVVHNGPPLLIVAGAGTGKTTVITRRVARLIEDKIAKPEEILAVTFTEKAAQEMEERVDQLLPYGYVDLWISTFHSFCQRILEQHALDIGLPADFKVVTQTEAWRLVRHNLKKFDLDYYRPLGNPTKFLHALIQHFSRCKDEDITPENYLTYAEALQLNSDSEITAGLQARRVKEVAQAYHIYQQILFENSALDFGDLIVQTLRLFKERPKILELYRRRFKEILVDEFQDTNWAQFELIKLLRPGTEPTLTVVGDDDQSIFAFRGASMSNILHFKETYLKAREIVLTENYRSTQNILNFSYSFIKQNDPERLESRLGIKKQLKAARDGEGKIAHLFFQTEHDEVRGVRDKILSLIKEEKASWDDFAILVRANSYAEPFLRIFDEADIPYQFLASSGLLRAPVVLDVLAFFRLLDNYHESRALYRFLKHQFLGIPNSDLEELLFVTRRKPWSLYEVIKQHRLVAKLSPETRNKLEQILTWVERYTTLARRSPITKVYLAFLNETGFLAWVTGPLQNRVGGSEERRSREYASHLRQFYKRLEQFEKIEPEPTVRHFLEETDLVLASGDSGALETDIETGPEAVKIFTIHGAKGLEFRYVFVVNAVEQRFPSVERREPIEVPDALIKEIVPGGDIHLQEERRLCYVAVTRAKDGIFFTSAEDYGGTRRKKPSRFLYELELVKKEEKKTPTSRIDFLSSSQEQPQAPAVVFQNTQHQYSFSQLRAYDTCPLQYKFAHIIRIPVAGKPTFVYGRAIHDTLHKFFNEILQKKAKVQPDLFGATKNLISNSRELEIRLENGKIAEATNEEGAHALPPLERLLAIYEECWKDDWFEDKTQRDEYKKQGEKGLRQLYEQIKLSPPQIKYLEKDFTIKVGAYTLKGRIDRVDQTQDGVEIVDYKTGRGKKELTAEDKQQLLIYQLAASDPHVLNEKVVNLKYYYVDEAISASFLGSEKDLARLKEWILHLIEKIQSNDFIAAPGWHCQHCDFKDICEFAEV